MTSDAQSPFRKSGSRRLTMLTRLRASRKLCHLWATCGMALNTWSLSVRGRRAVASQLANRLGQQALSTRRRRPRERLGIQVRESFMARLRNQRSCSREHEIDPRPSSFHACCMRVRIGDDTSAIAHANSVDCQIAGRSARSNANPRFATDLERATRHVDNLDAMACGSTHMANQLPVRPQNGSHSDAIGAI